MLNRYSKCRIWFDDGPAEHVHACQWVVVFTKPAWRCVSSQFSFVNSHLSKPHLSSHIMNKPCYTWIWSEKVSFQLLQWTKFVTFEKFKSLGCNVLLNITLLPSPKWFVKARVYCMWTTSHWPCHPLSLLGQHICCKLRQQWLKDRLLVKANVYLVEPKWINTCIRRWYKIYILLDIMYLVTYYHHNCTFCIYRVIVGNVTWGDHVYYICCMTTPPCHVTWDYRAWCSLKKGWFEGWIISCHKYKERNCLNCTHWSAGLPLWLITFYLSSFRKNC